MQMTAREAMHLTELRSQPAGHPSYRAVAQEMHRQIVGRAPGDRRRVHAHLLRGRRSGAARGRAPHRAQARREARLKRRSGGPILGACAPPFPNDRTAAARSLAAAILLVAAGVIVTIALGVGTMKDLEVYLLAGRAVRRRRRPVRGTTSARRSRRRSPTPTRRCGPPRWRSFRGSRGAGSRSSGRCRPCAAVLGGAGLVRALPGTARRTPVVGLGLLVAVCGLRRRCCRCSTSARSGSC